MSGPNQLSFLPDDYLDRKARRRANVLCALGAFVVLGVAGAVFWYTEKLTGAVEKRFVEVDKKYGDAAKRIEKVNQMRQQQQQVVRRAELAASLVEKVPRSNVLAEFTNSLPQGLSLLNVGMESREKSGGPAPAMTAFEAKRAALEGRAIVAAPAAKVYDVFIKIEGIAATDVQVAQFITKLNRSLLFRDVNLVVSEEFKVKNPAAEADPSRRDEAEVVRKFQIEMMLNPAAEVMNPVNPNTRTAAVEVGEAKGKAKGSSTTPGRADATAGADAREIGTK
jgi:Tfp pilus assembly protein PilN